MNATTQRTPTLRTVLYVACALLLGSPSLVWLFFGGSSMRQGSFLGGVKVSEAEVLRDVMHLLALKRVFHWRNNSGAYADATSGRYIRFGKKGSADILAVYPDGSGRFWAIECKRPKGLLSDDQILFLRDVRKHGGISTVCEGVEDILRFLSDPRALNAERYEKLLG